MSGAILALLILIFILAIVFGIIVYSYTFYYKNLYYKTTPYKWNFVWVILVLDIISLIFVIIGFVYKKDNNSFFAQNGWFVGLSLALFIFLSIIVCFIFYFKKKFSKPQKQIKDFYKDDFVNQLLKLKESWIYSSSISRLEKVRSEKLKNMKEDYRRMMNLEIPIDFEKTLIELVKFDQKYTSYWSISLNILKLSYFLEIATKLKNSAH